MTTPRMKMCPESTNDTSPPPSLRSLRSRVLPRHARDAHRGSVRSPGRCLVERSVELLLRLLLLFALPEIDLDLIRLEYIPDTQPRVGWRVASGEWRVGPYARPVPAKVYAARASVVGRYARPVLHIGYAARASGVGPYARPVPLRRRR
eukprot:1627857-Rhodomonas_salina.1